MRKGKLIKALAISMATGATVLAGCGAAGKGEAAKSTEGSNSLTIAVSKDESTLSPFTYVSGTGLTVNRLIYDTLLTTNEKDEIIPWMVEGDYEDVDSKEFTFTLKDGLKFHNGNPVTPEDIKFSFEYPTKQNVAGQRKVCDKIASIKVLDDKRIQFKLKEADVNFLRDGFSYIRIIDDDVYKNAKDATTVKDTVGSGMYKLVEYKTGEYYKLESVNDYFKGNVAVKEIKMPIIADATALQQGLLSKNIDASTGSVGMEMLDTFSKTPDLKVYSNPGFAPNILNINNGRAPFNNAKFREALSYGIDVNGICKTIYGDHALVGTKGLIRSDLPYAVSGLSYEYNKDKANSLLDELGYKKKDSNGYRLKDGKPLSISIITYSGNDTRSRICELTQSQLKEVGIKIDIQSMDMDTADTYIWPDFEVSKGRNYDMSTWGWSSSNSLTYLISLCSSDYSIGTYNVCGYKNAEIDKLVKEKLPKVKSQKEMEELLKELQNVVAKDIPLITVAYPDVLQVCNTARYNGWVSGQGMNVVNIFSFLSK